MDGVTEAAGKLSVTPTNLKIVEQDGSGGQANPPVNLYGTYLKSNGDFMVRGAFRRSERRHRHCAAVRYAAHHRR